MNSENPIIWATLIISLLFLFAYMLMVVNIFRATSKANDLTARKRWIWIVAPSGGFLLFLAVSFLLFNNDMKPESVYAKINMLSCLLSGMLPITIMNSLIQFTRRAPWFWNNREIFPHTIRWHRKSDIKKSQ